ncbi:hypothetical protein CEUSTIGMA_g391.t1 [Chlamydomonas eustigma]|uniref:Uncharacterized protein n=1 Tax=Chlamydomonas eustigma TaxID=1157962 RepID=A0A250WQG3_9CHLO|nr:hypothetical protein CEUSTIGMA_g391.t1 [Chlamydomonas eustigma]|eukprot:GAX72936.1 hypothetical protein CEUSTIGMA_g391.t1 [Chlamydomonas eustigma]
MSNSLIKVSASPENSGSDRRPLRFWQPFNDWWRDELAKLGRRPNGQEIGEWYTQNAEMIWKDEAPTIQETRVHAKCLRSLPLVREYFRTYRNKKRTFGSNGALITHDPTVTDGQAVQGGQGIHSMNEDLAAMEGMDVSPQLLQHQGNTGAPNHSQEQQQIGQPDVQQQYRSLMQSGGPMMDFMHGQHHALLHPHAMWSAQAVMDPSQPEIVRNLAFSQLQHVAAVQQQLTLAALAQQFAVSRAHANGLSHGMLMPGQHLPSSTVEGSAMDPFGSLEQLQQYYHSMGMPMVAQPQDIMSPVGEQDINTMHALQEQDHLEASGQHVLPETSGTPLSIQEVPLNEQLHMAQQQQQQGGQPSSFQEEEQVGASVPFQQQQQQSIPDHVILMSAEEEVGTGVDNETALNLRLTSFTPEASACVVGSSSTVQNGPGRSTPHQGTEEEVPLNDLMLCSHEELQSLSKEQLVQRVILLQARLREKVGG